MTEQEWMKCAEPDEMLLKLGEISESHRKVRLFMCACCRRIWDLFKDDRCRSAVEIAERYADELATDDEMNEAQAEVENFAEEAEESVLPHFEKLALVGSVNAAAYLGASENEGPVMAWDANTVAEWTVYAKTGSSAVADKEREARRRREFDAEVIAQCDLLRDIFGNPFQFTTIDHAWLAWRDGTVPKIAQTIYDERRFAELSILADALEEAGCADRDILDHCRQPGPHVRGCWVVDLLLGKQ